MAEQAPAENYQFQTCADCSNPKQCQFEVRIPGALLAYAVEDEAKRTVDIRGYSDVAFNRIDARVVSFEDDVQKAAKQFLDTRPECNMNGELVAEQMHEAAAFYQLNGAPAIET